MRTSLVVLFITALAAAVIGLAAYIRYRRRLAAALSEDSDTSVRQHRSASPAEFIPWLLIALLVIWNGVTLGKISSTSASLDNYAGNIQSQLLALRSQVQELEEKLSAQSALLLDYDWQFGEIDSQKHQVAIIYRMTPASLPKNAQFSLLSGTQTFPCTREADGSLTATIRADLFQLITDFPLSQVRCIRLPQLIESLFAQRNLNSADQVVTEQQSPGSVETRVSASDRRKLQRFKPFPLSKVDA